MILHSLNWWDQNLRFTFCFLFFFTAYPILYTSCKFYVQCVLILSLPTTSTSTTLAHTTVISCLEDTNNLLNCSPTFILAPIFPQRRQNDLLKNTLDHLLPLLKSLQELILGIKSRSLSWLKVLQTQDFDKITLVAVLRTDWRGKEWSRETS